MQIIREINPYDQLISIISDSRDRIPALSDLPNNSTLPVPPKREPEIRSFEKKTSSSSGEVKLNDSIDLYRCKSSHESESFSIEKRKIHKVPSSFISELGVEAATVLYGLSMILKNHKANHWNGRYWYYDSLDELIRKHWPYLKRTFLSEIIKKLSDKEHIVTRNNNKISYDRTTHYSVSPGKIDLVLKGKLFTFDTKIASQHGVLAALLFHNIQFEILNPRITEIDCLEAGEYGAKIGKLAATFGVSSSTIKRQLKILVKEGLLIKGSKQGSYSLPTESPVLKSGSNPNMDVQECPINEPEITGSNPNESGSFLNESRSNANASRSNPDDNTIYESNWNHMGIQMRNAPRIFLKEDAIEEQAIPWISHPNFSKKSDSDLSVDQIDRVAVNKVSHLEKDPSIVSLRVYSELPEKRSEIAFKAPQADSKIDHTGTFEKEAKLETLGQLEDQPPNLLDLGAVKASSTACLSTRNPELASDSTQRKEQVAPKFKSLVSFGRKIEIFEKSKFSKIEQENSRISKEFLKLEATQQIFARESFLRLAIRFIESLGIEKRKIFIEQNSVDRVLDLVFDDAFSFLEDKIDEFRFNEEHPLSHERLFPLFPFLELVVRGILLFRKQRDDHFQIDEFTLYTVFETLSYGLLDRSDMSPEAKALFFNFLILRARVTGIDNKASNGKAVDIKRYLGKRLSDYSAFSSEKEFGSLVGFFQGDTSICAEEVFFKYFKSVELKLTVPQDGSGYEERWHCLNFKDISQFLRFLPKISESIENDYPEFRYPWRAHSRVECDFHPSIPSRESIEGESESDYNRPDINSLMRIKNYFRKAIFLEGFPLESSSTPLQEADFKEALLLCEEYKLAPEDIVDLADEKLEKSSERLSSFHLRGALVKKALNAEVANSSRNSMLLTNDNISIEELWEGARRTVNIYTSNVRSTKDVLMDSSFKYFAWFRILVTEEPVPEIIEKYRHIALKELDYKVKKFIRKNGLDMSRITG